MIQRAPAAAPRFLDDEKSITKAWPVDVVIKVAEPHQDIVIRGPDGAVPSGRIGKEEEEISILS